jgi:hypothetical protein
MKFKMKGFVVAITKPQLQDTNFQVPRYVKRNISKTAQMKTIVANLNARKRELQLPTQARGVWRTTMLSGPFLGET